MKVLVAGASGALGTPTVRLLVERGHDVLGITRSQEKAEALRGMGAGAVIADVLDPEAAERAVAEVAPGAIVQLLNALPKRGPLRPSELDKTNELRIRGTAHLLDAALRHGTARYVTESMIFGYGYGDRGPDPLGEDAPFAEPVEHPKMNEALRALAEMEDLVLGASRRGDIEGIVLRLGLFYGPGVGSTEFMISMLRRRLLFLPGGARGLLSWIHVDDGASAVVAALGRAPAGSVYNVVDDTPASMGDLARELAGGLGLRGPKSVPMALARLVSSYAAAMANTTLRASNARIKAELGWVAAFPGYREGIAQTVRDRRGSRAPSSRSG